MLLLLYSILNNNVIYYGIIMLYHNWFNIVYNNIYQYVIKGAIYIWLTMYKYIILLTMLIDNQYYRICISCYIAFSSSMEQSIFSYVGT